MSVVLGGALGVRLRGAGVSLATLDVVFDVPVVAFGGDLFGREGAQCRLCKQRRDRRLGGVEPAAGRGDVDFELGQQLGGLHGAGEVAVVGERLLEVGVGVSVDAPRVPAHVGCQVGFVNGRDGVGVGVFGLASGGFVDGVPQPRPVLEPQDPIYQPVDGGR